MVAFAEIENAEAPDTSFGIAVALEDAAPSARRPFSASEVCSGEQGKATFTGYVTDDETGLMYARERMYSSALGRFIGRDGSGYVDGFSLYGGYFIPNRLDPFGETVTATTTPASEQGTPWYWYTSYRNHMGYTDMSYSVACECVECPSNPDCEEKINCTIEASFKIYINRRYADPQTGTHQVNWGNGNVDTNTWETYGHEQLHVRNMLAQIKDIARQYNQASEACRDPEQCSDDADGMEDSIESDIDAAWAREAGHSNAPDPTPTGGYPPTGPMPPPGNPGGGRRPAIRF